MTALILKSAHERMTGSERFYIAAYWPRWAFIGRSVRQPFNGELAQGSRKVTANAGCQHPDFDALRWSEVHCVPSTPVFLSRKNESVLSRIIGRGERIRTSGPCLPKTVLYQAELLPDRVGSAGEIPSRIEARRAL